MKKGASMLELIVAIVVMGIAVMALPLMLTTTQSGNAIALEQEGILASMTKLGDILTYRWDENSEQNGTIRVLDTNSSYFRRYNNSNRRVGHIRGNLRRKFYATQIFASTTLDSETGETLPDDIDDFNDGNDTNISVVISDSNASQDYKFADMNMHITVAYIDDNSTANSFNFNTTNEANGTTNIKRITLTTTITDASSPDKNLSITLRAFSCNIGENEIARRVYQ